MGAIKTTYFDASGWDLAFFYITAMTFSSAVLFICDNSFAAAETNHLLVDCDNTFPRTGTGSVNIANSNAAPDTTSGGYDGQTAKDNLILNGYTVTTN